jgi:cytochrome P450
VWVIGRYDEARAALVDPRLSKDVGRLTAIVRDQLEAAGEDTELSGMFFPHMLFADPPNHTRLRKLLAREFTPRRVAALQPRIERLTTELLDALPADEPVDLVERFAFLLPVTVICELLGIPVEDREPFRGWTAALMHDRPEITLPASHATAAYFTELIAAKRAEPGEDLLSALTVAADDGDRLSEEELLGTAFLLLVAGHETTTNLLGNAVRWLLSDRYTWQRLGSEPGLVAGAVEEVLRFDSPVRMTTYRYTAEPVEIGGVTIPVGQIVLISLSSANRDFRRFDRADVLDLYRKAGGHLTFGHGIHYCLGASLARLEAEIALGQLIRRFPDACLALPLEQLHHRPSVIMNGLHSLPVVLQPSNLPRRPQRVDSAQVATK